MSGKKLVLGFAVLLGLTLVVAALITLSGNAVRPPLLRPIALEALPEPTDPGATLLVSRCMACHSLPDPAAHTKAEWIPVLRRMAAHSSVQHMKPPDVIELKALSDYLGRHASDAR